MQHPSRADKLRAAVAAVNKANAAAHKLYAQLSERFAPLVGQKILKADGSLMAKFEPLVADLPNSTALSTYRYRSNYSLVYVVKVCEPLPPHGCTYHESSVYVGELDGQTLKSIAPPFVGRYDFTEEEITEKRAALTAAEEAVSAAQSALIPFGAHD